MKCRWCSEWLDPSQRPASSTTPANAPQAPRAATIVGPAALRPAVSHAAAPAETSQAARTHVDGSLHEPRPREDEAAPRSWAPPPWLADGANAAEAAAPTPAVAPTPTIVAAPAPSVVAAPAPSVAAAPAATVVTARAPVPAAAPVTATGTVITTGEAADANHAASLQEVALRMERIKASAAAIRQAIEHEAEHAAAAPSSAPSPATMGLDEDDFSGLADPPTISDGPAPGDAMDERPNAAAPRTVVGNAATLAAPTAAAPLSALERDFLGDDDDFGEASTEDFGDGGFDAGAFAPAPRPIPWRPILIAAGVMVAIGAYAFRGLLFPSPTEVEPADAVAKEDVRPGSVAPDAGKPKADPAAGKAVQPEPAGAPPSPTPSPTAGTPSPTTSAPTAGTPAPTAAAVGGPPPTPAARPTPDADTSARLDEARALYQSAKGGSSRKKLGEAKTLLQEILATAPKQADALLLLAQIELELGKADAALATATQCTEVASDLADCWLTIGVLQQDRNKKAEAATAYEKYLALAPDGRYAGDVRSQLKRLKK